MLLVMPSGLHRTYGAHHLHFITCLCYRRLPLLDTARGRDRFLSILEQTRQRYRFVVVGYVVMPEHIHLLITEPEVANPSTVMQGLKQRTARALLPKRKPRDPRQRNLFGEKPQCRALWQARFYDFNVVDHEEARAEAAVYASQSGEAETGGVTGAVALEQLSVLWSRRSRPGAREFRVDGDFLATSGGVGCPAAIVRGSRPFAKNAKDRAPPVLLMPASSKAGPPACWKWSAGKSAGPWRSGGSMRPPVNRKVRSAPCGSAPIPAGRWAARSFLAQLEQATLRLLVPRNTGRPQKPATDSRQDGFVFVA